MFHSAWRRESGACYGRWNSSRPSSAIAACLYPERVFLPQIYDLLDDTGRLQDTELLGRLKTQASGFTDFVERLKNVKLRGTRA